VSACRTAAVAASIWALGVVAILVGAWGLVPDGPNGHVAWIGALVSTAAHALASRGATRQVRRAMIAASVVAMAGLAFAAPLFSDDVWRYIADGHVGAAGLNPYAWPPSSPKVHDLVHPWLAQINHPELPTIYPPVAQAVFAGLAILGAGATGFRLAAIGAWAAAAALAERMRPATEARAGAGWWMLTHPLALLSVGANGHVDAFGVLALVAGLLAWQLGSRHDGHARDVLRGHLAGAVALGLAAGVKLFPVGLGVALFGRHRLRRVVAVGVVSTAVLAATYVPIVAGGGPAFGSLGRYAEAWTYNAGPQAVAQTAIDAGMRAAGVPSSVEVAPISRWREARGETTVYGGEATSDAWYGRNELARAATRLLALLALVVSALVVRRRRLEPVAATTAVLVVLFAASPVVHPWYLLWVLAPAAICGDRVALAWCGSTVVAFGAAARTLDGGPWTDPVFARCIVYAAPVIIAILAARRTPAPFDNPAPADTVEDDSAERVRRG